MQDRRDFAAGPEAIVEAVVAEAAIENVARIAAEPPYLTLKRT